ncbi:MAG: M13 family metallopeptidase [Endozoicomonas sp.]|uniref:M13 family metallopeptidase n=1 Tax=Endozoicomonas sp. TaxID=1892382 RepID=UPI003D9BF817
MDLSTSPGEDFYRYVNGGWQDRTKIPEERVSWNSLDEAAERTHRALKKIMEQAISSSRYALDTDQGKALHLYKAGMDEASIEQEGITPIYPFLAAIASLESKDELPKLLADFHRQGIDGFFFVDISPDRKDSDKNVVSLLSSGISLGNRDYYTLDTHIRIRNEYRSHIFRMLQHLGEPSAYQKADHAMLIERKLALATLEQTKKQDDTLTYHRKTLAELVAENADFNFDQYFQSYGIEPQPYLIIQEPEFLKAVNEVISESSLEEIKAYLKWKLINASAPFLTADILKQHWTFFNQKITGAKKMRPRWKIVLEVVNADLGFAVGKLYVKDHFSQATKADIESMTENIRSTFMERIDQLTWMTQATKTKAREKLAAIKTKIGHPDQWESYDRLHLEASDGFLTTHFKTHYARTGKLIASLRQPVDRNKWAITPQTVNAEYVEKKNEIILTAAFLQPPLYDPETGLAEKYGSTGAFIAHELTHGFDDLGRLYNAQGSLENWWQEEDEEAFNQIAEKLVKQFNQYTLLGHLQVNGQLTLGENIADLGGVTLAYHAFMKTDEQSKASQTSLPFSQEQRFFITWTSLWREKIREKALQAILGVCRT